MFTPAGSAGGAAGFAIASGNDSLASIAACWVSRPAYLDSRFFARAHRFGALVLCPGGVALLLAAVENLIAGMTMPPLS